MHAHIHCIDDDKFLNWICSSNADFTSNFLKYGNQYISNVFISYNTFLCDKYIIFCNMNFSIKKMFHILYIFSATLS